MSAADGVIDTMHDCAIRLRAKGCTELSADLDEASAAVDELIVQARIADDLLAHEGFRADDVPRCDLRAALVRCGGAK